MEMQAVLIQGSARNARQMAAAGSTAQGVDGASERDVRASRKEKLSSQENRYTLQERESEESGRKRI